MRRLITDDRGSATVLGAWAIAAVTVVLVLVSYLGAAVVARHRAQSVADLAALAGAIAQSAGDDACDQAKIIADRQQVGARMVDCAVVDDDVTVTVELEVSLGRIGIRSARALARAGPVDE